MTRRVFGIMGGSLVVSVLALLTAAMVGRSLGPAGMGEYQAIIRWTTVGIGVFCLSLGQASAFLSSKRGVSFGSLVRNAMAAAFVQATALVLLGYLLAPSLYGNNQRLLDAGRLFLLLAPIALVNDYLGHLARAKLRIAVFNAARLTQASTQSALVLLLYVTGHASLLAVIGACLVSYGASLMVLAGYAIWRDWFRGHFDMRLLRRTLGYAAHLHPGVEARELNLYVDQLMMTMLLPLASLGLYASAVSAASVLRVGSSAFLLLAQPEVQAVSAAERRFVIIRLARLNLLILLPAAVALAVAMPLVLPAVYGQAFAPAVPAAQILCTAIVIEGFSVAMGGVLIGIGRASVATFWHLTSLVVSVIALIIWLPVGQILAAAWISVLSYSIAAIGMIAAVARAESIPFAELILPRNAEIGGAVRFVRRHGRAGR